MVFRGRFRHFCLVGLIALLMSAACASPPKKREFPDDFSAEEIREMGAKYLAAGETVRALKLLSIALDKDGKDPATHYQLGVAYHARDLKDKAVEHLQKAVELKEDYSEAYNALGAIYAEEGQLGKAQQAFQEALGNPFYETPHYAYFNLARLHEKRGRTDQALKLYRKAVDMQPTYAMAHYRIGRLLESKGRRGEARQAYGQAIYYAPEMIEAQFHYGRLSFLQGDMKDAYSALNQVLILDPRSSLAKAAREYLDKIQVRQPSRMPSYDMRQPYDMRRQSQSSPYDYGY